MKRFFTFVLALAIVAGVTNAAQAQQPLKAAMQLLLVQEDSCKVVAQTLTPDSYYPLCACEEKSGRAGTLLCVTVGECPDKEFLQTLVSCGLVDSEEAYKALRNKAVVVLAKKPPAKYTVDLSYASQSAFKLFGQVASTRPIGTTDITVEKGRWSAEIIVVGGIGHQNEGQMADYYDGLITRSWESGAFSGTTAVEVFHAPAQLSGPKATFISPLATVKWKHNDHFSIQTGVQYVGTYKTEYGDDRIYGWIEPMFSFSLWRLSLDVSPGYIVGNTGRTTQYVSSTLSIDLWSGSSLYGSYLQAESWGTGEPGMVPIDGTWTYGVAFNF